MIQTGITEKVVAAIEKQILEWQQGLSQARVKLQQSQAAVKDAEAQVAGFEGGLLFSQSLLNSVKATTALQNKEEEEQSQEKES